jgi:hypothetical protein
MNKMKTTIAIAAALVAGASTQSFAAATAPVYSKVGTITFALTSVGQTNISTSKTQLDAGNWTDNPEYYKTLTSKITQGEIIKYISEVLYGSPSGFTSKAKLILVQGELSGFFNITPDLADAQATNFDNLAGPWSTPVTSPIKAPDASTVLANAHDSAYFTLPNGRHFQTEPDASGTNTTYPAGHFQPWGQIFVQDGTKEVNVTPFFHFAVHECYDCFYLNSFVTDAAFSFKNRNVGGGIDGPPCCYTPPTPINSVTGSGTDRYYLTIGFDNTVSNPYLDPASAQFIGIGGLVPSGGVSTVGLDGVTPDGLEYVDKIASGLFSAPAPYEARFTLNGVFVYKWQLKVINKTDSYPDFIGVGAANYTSVNGYGFIGLTCQVITGTGTITEANVANGFGNTPWYNDWYGFDDAGPANSPVPYNAPASLTEHYSTITLGGDTEPTATAD